MPYAFKHPLKRFLASVFDTAGRILCRHAKRPVPEPLKTIVVIRVDQIGDVVFADPFLRALKSRLPAARVLFLTSPAGKELYGPGGAADEVIAFDAPWFHYPASLAAACRGFFDLGRVLESLAPDVIIDLRGDARHILAAAWGSPRSWRSGYGRTGGGFLLDAEPAYEDRAHAAERNLKFLEPFGPVAGAPALEIGPRIAATPLPEELMVLLPSKTRRRVALHAGAGAPSKEWPDAHWVSFARAAAAWDADFFWIGDAAAHVKTRRILGGLADLRERFTDLSGRLPLASLGTFFETCDFLVTGDSGPAHVAASRKLKTLVVFSGANEIFEWKPLSREADIVYREVPCSPCHERVCPRRRHDCMEDLLPETVILEANRLFREKNRN